MLAGAAAVPVVALALAQAVLPGLAANRVRDKVARYGHVDGVHVSAWPAVELLWGKAGSATAHATHLSLTPAQAGDLLWEARGVGSLALSADSVTLKVPVLPNGLTVHQVTMRKHGSDVQAHATLTQAQLDAALPGGFHVEPVASGPEGIVVKASGGLFGSSASLQALVGVSDGQIVAQPQGLPFAALARVVLLVDDHLHVQSVGLAVTSRQPRAYGLSLTASLS